MTSRPTLWHCSLKPRPFHKVQSYLLCGWEGVEHNFFFFFFATEKIEEQGDSGIKSLMAGGSRGWMLQLGSVHHHAFPEISSGIQPFLPCDYLLLSTKACFGCAQPAYCQLSGPIFRIKRQNRGRRHDRITFCNASIQKAIFFVSKYCNV